MKELVRVIAVSLVDDPDELLSQKKKQRTPLS